MGQYFESDNLIKHKEKSITFKVQDYPFTLTTDIGVFSRNGLDFGSRVLLNALLLEIKTGKVLDMGCGYGALSIPLCVINNNITCIGVDVSERASSLANRNAKENKVSDRVMYIKSDLYENVDEKFDYIISNPPIRAGKRVTYSIYEEGFNYLVDGGCLIVVIQKKQGALSAKTYIESIYGNCNVIAKDSGYLILKAIKNAN